MRPSPVSIPVPVDNFVTTPPLSVEIWLAGPQAAAHFRPAQIGEADRARHVRLSSARRRRDFEVSRALLAQVAPAAPWTLSHSGGYAALAQGSAARRHACGDLRLGIDLEWHRPRDFTSLADFAFSAEERVALRGMSAARRAAHFYRLWVMKEALAKALDLPLLEALAHCTFTCHEGVWRGAVPCERPWAVFLYEPRAGLSLALAASTARPLAAPRVYEWPPGRPGTWPMQRLSGAGAASGERCAPPAMRQDPTESATCDSAYSHPGPPVTALRPDA